MTTHMNFTRKAKILIVSTDRASAEFMESSLLALSTYEPEHVTFEALSNPRNTLKAENYDLLLMDVGDGAVLEGGAISEVRKKFASTPLILLSEVLSDQRMRMLVRLNANDWLRKPLERKAFLESISSHLHLAFAGGNQVHAVVSAVGGAGATSVAITLADSLLRLKRKQEPTVALFDLDFSTGACGSYLNSVNDYDLKPVIAQPNRVDLEFVDIIKKKHERGFSLLSFKQPDVLLSRTGGELVLRMLDVVSFQNNHTVLDIPYYATGWRDDLLKAVNTIHLVTEPTIPALAQAKDLATRIQTLRPDNPPVHIIVNKNRRRLFSFGIGKNEAKRVFKQTPTHLIDDDWNTMSEAINRGVLPFEVSPRSSFVRRIEKLAEGVK
ncbi:pilus assembly protein [Pseudaminobacter sp. 19-2017]|uniref:Pilus assembly protein n=1 Tax=Pseudaminobacter soli (ex Zhang et al. 2022) TaxID=2831468 RepID=A0A942DW91_9HYPH|nr:pilus assembly protein [Pseudaminobacter soli]MBS3648103.1 pilus assembly protein [Pseudaminobacter soli]